MADVEVSVGANISPFQSAMAQVRAQAKATGDSIGVNIGDRSGFRDELRMQRGLENFTRVIATSQDPIQGLVGGLESLSAAFRITGGLFVGFAIGNALRDQLLKAASAAESFYDKTSQIFAVGKESSRQFAEEAVKNFDEAQKAYGDEGFFHKLIYGAGERQTLERGSPIVEEIRRQVGEANAQLIRDQTELISSQGDPIKKSNAQIDLAKDEYAKKIDDATTQDEKVALQEQLQAKIDEINHQYFEEDSKRNDESIKKFHDAADKRIEDEKKVQEEKDKQQKLLDERGEKTPKDRLAAVQKEIDQHQIVMQMVGTQLELYQRGTKEIELQNQKLSIQAEIDANKAKLQFQLFDEIDKQTEAKVALNSALNEADIFHGQVSSLQRIGLGGGTGPNNNADAIKKLEESRKVLEKIQDGIETLNGKIEST